MHVSLTGEAAWQMGSTGIGRTEWQTVPCECGLCASGRFFALDEMVSFYEDEPPKHRHISKGAVHVRNEDGSIRTNAEKAFPPVSAYNPAERKRGRR